MEIKVKKLTPDGILPTRANKGDAGYDLYSTEDYTLKPLERKLFKTGIAIAIPEGYYGRIAPRSGLAFKNGIDVLGGVIDATYRNDVGVILMNLNSEPDLGITSGDFIAIALQKNRTLKDKNSLDVKKGDRIAQIIIEKCHDAEWAETDSLDETDRNLKGFGASGR